MTEKFTVEDFNKNPEAFTVEDFEKNPEAYEDIITDGFKQVCFDYQSAEALLGCIVTCIKKHHDVPENTIGYFCSAHHMEEFSFLQVEWQNIKKSDRHVYAREEVIEYISIEPRKFDCWKNINTVEAVKTLNS